MVLSEIYLVKLAPIYRMTKQLLATVANLVKQDSISWALTPCSKPVLVGSFHNSPQDLMYRSLEALSITDRHVCVSQNREHISQFTKK